MGWGWESDSSLVMTGGVNIENTLGKGHIWSLNLEYYREKVVIHTPYTHPELTIKEMLGLF